MQHAAGAPILFWFAFPSFFTNFEFLIVSFFLPYIFLLDKSLSQPWCSHSNTIYDLQLQKTIVLRMQPLHQATLTQPLQCDLPPQLQETHRTTHADTTTRCKTHRRNNSRMKRPQPQPPHRRGTFHRRLQPLYTEKHKVSCSSFLPNTKPMQHHAAIPMRSATTASRNA